MKKELVINFYNLTEEEVYYLYSLLDIFRRANGTYFFNFQRKYLQKNKLYLDLIDKYSKEEKTLKEKRYIREESLFEDSHLSFSYEFYLDKKELFDFITVKEDGSKNTIESVITEFKEYKNSKNNTNKTKSNNLKTEIMSEEVINVEGADAPEIKINETAVYEKLKQAFGIIYAKAVDTAKADPNAIARTVKVKGKKGEADKKKTYAKGSIESTKIGLRQKYSTIFSEKIAKTPIDSPKHQEFKRIYMEFVLIPSVAQQNAQAKTFADKVVAIYGGGGTKAKAKEAAPKIDFGF